MLLALALLALALLVLATPAQAAKKSIWGPAKLPDGSSAFALYEDLGVDVYQMQLSWLDVAPVRPDPSLPASDPANPSYVWPARLDETIADAASHGIEVAIMLKGRGTPAWANGDRGSSWVPDSDADFADYAAAAARKYPSVRYWMVWGETTQLDNFNPMPANSPEGPRRYALLLDAAYAALKGVRQSNLVIGGMTHTAGVIRPRKYIDWLRLPDGRAAPAGPVRPQPAELSLPAPIAGSAACRHARHVRPRHAAGGSAAGLRIGPRARAVPVGVHDLLRPAQPRLRDRRHARRAGALADGGLPHRRRDERRRAARLV